LSRAIEDGHKVKAIAIVKRAPEVVTIDHVRQAQARPETEGVAKWVANTYSSKQAPPAQLSNVQFTGEQLAALQAGKAVKVEGLELKKGEDAGKKVDRWVAWSSKTGRCQFYKQEPKQKLDAAAKQASPKQDAAEKVKPPKKKMSMKM
jgi:hypothetical protein